MQKVFKYRFTRKWSSIHKHHIWNLFSEWIFNTEEKKRKNDAKEGKYQKKDCDSNDLFN